MNLPLLASQMGLPKNGLIAVYDGFRDTAGRNILPVGAEDFVTGWSTVGGATVTVTDYQTTLNGVAITAKRIQSTGGTNAIKYSSGQNTLSNPHNVFCALYAKVLSGNLTVVIDAQTYNTRTTSAEWVIATTGAVNATTNNGWLYLSCDSESENLDIVLYQPQINLNSFAPYSLPAGLPQSATDYSGNGNTAQLGSTSGVDTNDPAWSGNGWVFGTDDYLTTSLPLTGDRTLITVCKTPSSFTGNGSYFFMDASTPDIFTFYTNELGDYVYNNSYNGTVSTMSVAMTGGRLPANTALCLGFVAGKNLQKMYKGFTGYAINPNGNPNSITLNKIQAINNCALHIMAIYNRALSDAEYLRAYNYLKRYLNSKGVSIA